MKEYEETHMEVFKELESEVRSYCRSFPAIFTKAKGCKLWDIEGKEYLDFFSGAGALNYGHNNPLMKEKLLQYIADDGITHGLDMATKAKEDFIKNFHEIILKPRKMSYKFMFPGPTGTNAVESALKLARKVTGRELIISFTNAFHGMTLGSLAVTGNSFKRKGAGLPLNNTVFMPFDKYLGDDIDTVDYVEQFLENNGSGVSLPAAIILETVQGEGGLNTASFDWLKKVENLCRKKSILLIVDDIQAGCGRTGSFFSFEPSGIQPDIICLSKSLSGYGLPMALNLIKPEFDAWAPGEHNGTFRGNNLAFLTATVALDYWKNEIFCQQIQHNSDIMRHFLDKVVQEHSEIKGEVRGRGLMQGIACHIDGMAEKICANAFKRRLLVETSGPNNEVVKLLPPLLINETELHEGFEVIEESIDELKRIDLKYLKYTMDRKRTGSTTHLLNQSYSM